MGLVSPTGSVRPSRPSLSSNQRPNHLECASRHHDLSRAATETMIACGTIGGWAWPPSRVWSRYFSSPGDGNGWCCSTSNGFGQPFGHSGSWEIFGTSGMGRLLADYRCPARSRGSAFWLRAANRRKGAITFPGNGGQRRSQFTGSARIPLRLQFHFCAANGNGLVWHALHFGIGF